MAIHYTSNSGSDTWANSTNIGTPCSLGTAVANAAAGDTVYLRGGTYTIGSGTAAFEPTNSGSAGNRITFAAYQSEVPVLTQADYQTTTVYGFLFSGRSYITLDHITFQDLRVWGQMVASSHHNIISYCIFTSTSTDTDWGYGIEIKGNITPPNYNYWNTHNWIHHCTFLRRHNVDPGAESTNIISIGGSYSAGAGASDPGDSYNTIEDNEIAYSGHAGIEDFGPYNVIRNNIFHNEPWITGVTTGDNTPTYVNPSYNNKFGHRNMQISDDYARTRVYELVEGNRFGHASNNPGNHGPMELDCAAPGNIIRFNYMFNGMQSGIYFKYAGNAATKGTGGPGGIDNRIYNNTIYHEGYGYDWATYDQGYFSGHGIAQWNGGVTYIANQIKNNIIYDSGNGDVNSLWDNGHDPETYDVVSDNWFTVNGDPKFVNPDVTDATSLVLPDLALQSSSPCINNGNYLTLASGSGNASTALTVDDALYFQDGTWGSSLSDIQADWIAIGSVSNIVEISSINYGTNVITLASVMTWADNAPIWLYKKSDGVRVLYGSAPHYGAYQDDQTGSAGLRIRII
jgi:hypothetical protein